MKLANLFKRKEKKAKSLASFLLHASASDQRRVFMKVADLANKDQRAMVKQSVTR